MNKNCIRSLSLVLAFMGAAVSPAFSEEPRPVSPVDMVEINFLSDPDISPDGRYLIYLRKQTDWVENAAFDRYVLVDMQNGKELPTFEANKDDEDFGSVVWRPGSQGFVTLLKRKFESEKEAKEKDNEKSKDKATRQAYFFNINTGSLTQLTDSKTDVGNVQWLPDGSGFYYTAKRPHDEAYEKALKDKFVIKAYETKQPDEIWFHNLSGEKSTKLLSGDDYIRGYDLSDDGQKILYMRADGPNRDDRHGGDLWSYEPASKKDRQLTDNSYAENGFEFSPNNKSFAYIATVNAKGDGYYQDNLFVQRLDQDRPELLLPEAQMEILSFHWGPNGHSIFILGNTGLRAQIYQYDFTTKALKPLTSGDHDIVDWTYDAATKTHSYIAENAQNPGEVFLLDEDQPPQQVSSEYAGWSDKFILPKQSAFHWKAQDGTKLEGLLVYPVDYVEGQTFPLITVTHGGPRDSSRFGSWNMSRAIPVLAGQGYGVFLPNHRGGTGYGDKFMRDMIGGYFNNAHLDVMSGIDALIDAGLADPDQLIKQGWSAGGHMTNKLITFTDIFKAASSGAGAADWVSMYGESDVRYRRTPWFGGAPWQKKAPLKTYQKNSPLKDAWKITTPTLFWSGASDVRVPPTQGIMMYRGAKAAGVDTKLYLAPGQPHGFKLPSYKLFKINTELAWYAKHLGQDIPSAVLPDFPEDISEPDETD